MVLVDGSYSHHTLTVATMGPKKEVRQIGYLKPGMVFAQLNASYVSKNRIFDTSYALFWAKVILQLNAFFLHPKISFFFFFFCQRPLEPGRNQDILFHGYPLG